MAQMRMFIVKNVQWRSVIGVKKEKTDSRIWMLRFDVSTQTVKQGEGNGGKVGYKWRKNEWYTICHTHPYVYTYTCERVVSYFWWGLFVSAVQDWEGGRRGLAIIVDKKITVATYMTTDNKHVSRHSRMLLKFIRNRVFGQPFRPDLGIRGTKAVHWIQVR